MYYYFCICNFAQTCKTPSIGGPDGKIKSSRNWNRCNFGGTVEEKNPVRAPVPLIPKENKKREISKTFLQDLQ